MRERTHMLWALTTSTDPPSTRSSDALCGNYAQRSILRAYNNVSGLFFFHVFLFQSSSNLTDVVVVSSSIAGNLLAPDRFTDAPTTPARDRPSPLLAPDHLTAATSSRPTITPSTPACNRLPFDASSRPIASLRHLPVTAAASPPPWHRKQQPASSRPTTSPLAPAYAHHSILLELRCAKGQSETTMDVEYHEEFVRNPRGVQLFTCGWLPASSSPKALVFLCHGYGMECSDFMRGNAHVAQTLYWNPICPYPMAALIVSIYFEKMFDVMIPCSNGGEHGLLAACGIKLATAGYGVFGIDYEGHGKSMGARCYIQKFDNLVADCDRFFQSICDMEEYRNKSRFLYGESMGGAVALLLHRKDPTFWDGAVLVAPMCKLQISEKVKPHPVVVTLLTQVEEIIPKWKIVPTKDIRKNKLIYQDKPRLKTALELLRTSMDVEDSLSQVRMPFFILHGEADTVTDPEVSRALYERAASADKTIKLYPGMWHGLTAGEPDENVELVFSDIVAWLDERSRHWKPEERARTPRAAEQHHQVPPEKIGSVRSSNDGTDSLASDQSQRAAASYVA
ncbi:hypothetical protein PR202_ga04428 [Eleusine coracana subsp. coracana]|uniref:Serine aminopeptidase S33 domain-containing protein n=1 Tax=Eleusine coracana subsp. coracana TaxID=191504 RepID=A0AAV5BRY7_ELECO|nr:hypothetical protein PR202_ga04428 [Eleusine coracana subsp. coracana]